MLLLTGVALSTATYAWFTANTLIQLGQIDVRVQATNGIQVSTDATNWKASLTTDEIRNAYYTGSTTQFPDVTNGDYLQPVSTSGSLTDGKFNMFYGVLQTNGNITLTKANETAGSCSVATAHTPAACATASGTWSEANDAYFIAFDLFIQSNANREVGLLPSSLVDATGTDAGLKDSIRVGFVINGTDATNTPATAYALAANADYTIWEPNVDAHTEKAIAQGNATDTFVYSYMGAQAVGTDVVLNNGTQFATVPAQIAPGADYIIQTNEVKTAAENPAYVPTYRRVTNVTGSGAAFTGSEWNTTAEANYPTVFSVTAGITKVRVYIWIEGQDVDCENNASLGSAVGVAINLNAKTVAP